MNMAVYRTRCRLFARTSSARAAMVSLAAYSGERAGQRRRGGGSGGLPDEVESWLRGKGELSVSHDRQLRVVLVPPVRPTTLVHIFPSGPHPLGIPGHSA